MLLPGDCVTALLSLQRAANQQPSSLVGIVYYTRSPVHPLLRHTRECLWLQAAGEEGFLPGMPGSVEAWAQDLRARFAQAQESERAARLPVDTAEGTQQVHRPGKESQTVMLTQPAAARH